MSVPSRRADTVRQIAVVVAVALMIVAALIGTGALGGTNVRDLQNGALDADATFVAPGRPAFAIWSVVYVLYVVYALWQAFPGQRARERQRFAGWWIVGTALLNGLWLLLAQFATLLATVVSIIVLLLSLLLTLRVLRVHRGAGVVDSLTMDAAVGIHTGWVMVATVANLAAWVTVSAPPGAWVAGAAAAALALVVVAAAGFALGWVTGRIAPALAMAWGLVWIAIARSTGEPESLAVTITAGLAAVVVLVAPAFGRVRRWRAEHPAVPSAQSESAAD